MSQASRSKGCSTRRRKAATSTSGSGTSTAMSDWNDRTECAPAGRTLTILLVLLAMIPCAAAGAGLNPHMETLQDCTPERVMLSDELKALSESSMPYYTILPAKTDSADWHMFKALGMKGHIAQYPLSSSSRELANGTPVQFTDLQASGERTGSHFRRRWESSLLWRQGVRRAVRPVRRGVCHAAS